MRWRWSTYANARDLLAEGEEMAKSLATVLTAFGFVVSSGLVLSIGTQTYTLEQLKVRGPVYDQIIDGKDLIADILPPPLYVVEAYMLALEAASDTEVRTANLTRMGDLKKSYDERRDFWNKSMLPPELKEKLEDDVLTKGDQFWANLNAEIVPALWQGDPSRVKAALALLKQAFHRHEIAVNELVAFLEQLP
jgi:methyl-accepting chemotaxis protein